MVKFLGIMTSRKEEDRIPAHARKDEYIMDAGIRYGVCLAQLLFLLDDIGNMNKYMHNPVCKNDEKEHVLDAFETGEKLVELFERIKRLNPEYTKLPIVEQYIDACAAKVNNLKENFLQLSRDD